MIPVHAGHHNIKNNKVKLLFLRYFKCVCPAFRLFNFVSLAPEQDVKNLPDLQIIIYNQHPGHVILSLFGMYFHTTLHPFTVSIKI